MSVPSLDPVSNWLRTIKFIIIAVFLLIIFGGEGWLIWSRNEWKTEAQEDAKEITQYQTANKEWSAKTAAANAALKAIITASNRRADEAAKAVAEATKAAESYDEKAKSILGLKAAVGDDPQCVATKKLFNSYFGGRS